MAELIVGVTDWKEEKKVFGAEKAQSYEAMIYVVHFVSFRVVGV